MTTNRRMFLGLAAGAVAYPLAGCAPGGSAPAPAQGSGPAAVTDPAKLPAATIKVMDTWTDKTSMQAQWVTAVNAAFTAKYPNLKVNRSSATFDDINKTLKLKLSDATTPDVVPANNGWQGIGTFAKAGLVRNLDDYATGYRWSERFPKTIAMQHQVAPDGSQIGTGSFFGVPMSQGGFITVYYSRAKFEKLNLAPPATFDDFTKALATAQAAGEVPMMIGTQDQWLSTTTLFALMNVFADKEKIANFVYGIGGTAADTGLLEAATTYQQWSSAGYLPKNFAGTSGADSGQAFVDGTGVFYFYYSDSLPFRSQEVADRFGTFLLPTDGRPLQATGSSNQNFSIATNSKNPDAAAAYLDFISGRESGELAVQKGVTPFNGEFTAPAEAGPLLKDEIAELNAVQKTDGFVPYFDWASPTMLDTMGSQTQQLLAGRTTPAKLVEACQKDYEGFRSSQGK